MENHGAGLPLELLLVFATAKVLADAAINGLQFHRHLEESAVEQFAKGIRMAGEMFLEDPFGIPLITNWNRVAAALPGFLEDFKAAVDADNRVVCPQTA